MSGRRATVFALVMVMLILGVSAERAHAMDAAKIIESSPVIPGGLSWGTYLGGTADDYCSDVARDNAGNIYVAGYTASANWILQTGTAYDGSYGGSFDGFVYKMTSDGIPLWGTYLGGSGDDQARTVAVDPATGDCYVGGQTKSEGWISGGYNSSLNGGSLDAFVVKLNSAGVHVWSTYLGGNATDYSQGIAVDPSGNVCLVGTTMSPGWTFGGYDTTLGGSYDAFAYKLSPTGVPLWSTCLGGSGNDFGMDVVSDTAGNFYVIGNSGSSGWISGGYNLNAKSADGFVVKLSPVGQHLWSTYLGGSDTDYGYGITLDSKGNVLAVGQTSSAGWVSGNYQNDYRGSASNGYVVKMTSDGKHLWSSYVGGVTDDIAFAVATDSADNIFITGNTRSADWVTGGFNLNMASSGYTDTFILKLSPSGQHIWSTLIGGTSNDTGYGILADSLGGIYIAGYTTFTYASWLSGGPNPNMVGGNDAFLVKLRDAQTGPAGTLRVGIKPTEATRAGAAWRFVGMSDWHSAGEAIPCLAPGNYQVEFKTLTSDWFTPATVDVTIKDGQTVDLAGQYKARLEMTIHSPLLMAARPGDTTMFAATASGLAPITMQWKKNGMPITGATGTTLFFNACQVADEGFYTCEATNLSGTLSSPPFHLIVNNGGAVLAYLLGLTTDPTGLDLNKDSKINVADVLAGVPQTPPQIPSGPIPVSGSTGVSRWPHLDWDDSLRAQKYDLFLWPAGTAEPLTPLAKGLTASQWDVPTTLTYHTVYQWRIKACGNSTAPATLGQVWTFTTDKAVRVVSPNGGENWTRGSTATVTWRADPKVAGTTMRIELWRGGLKMCVLKAASSDPGGLKTEIVTVPVSSGIPPSFNYIVRVISTEMEARGIGAAAWDESDRIFRIY